MLDQLHLHRDMRKSRDATKLLIGAFAAIFVLCSILPRESEAQNQGLSSLSQAAGQSQSLPSDSGSASLNGAPKLGSAAFDNFEFLPVEQAYPLAVESDADRGLRLYWQMPAGYYLYQHAFRFEVARGDKTLATDVSYPAALEREDEFFGRVQVYYDTADIALTSGAALTNARLTVTSQGCADAGLCYPPRTQYFDITADGSVSEVMAPTPVRSTVPSTSAGTPPATGTSLMASLLPMMMLAFLGGLVLNLMPCVLPILSLKVLSFACATAQQRHRHGHFYSLGVIGGFLAVAVLLIALRGAGQAVGWGFQLQSSGFVIALAYLFVLLGLGLSGVVQLGNRFVNLGSDLCAEGGARGSFFTGLLAVVVASPCTAPFMGSALGYALVQPPQVGLLVFAALGMGMAAPMLLLSYSEIARRHMPKPGPWTERLKQALAFPLYATALWLFWVAGRQTNIDVMAAALLGALFLALGLWLWRGAVLARGTAIVCVAAAVLLAGWRPEVLEKGPSATAELPAGSIAFSAETLERLRASGQPVFVDVTADWCITCLANERTVLSASTVQDAFRDHGVTYMVADWTDYDPGIAEFVASHGRSGIPLYVFYDPSRSPQVLPQILRKQVVLDVLRQGTGSQLARSR